jgi:hypothetical protein
LSDFARAIQQHYSQDQLKSGGVEAYDRHGEMCFHAILSLAIGIVHLEPNQCQNHLQVAEIAAQAKKVAKKEGGNACVLFDLNKNVQNKVALCC